MLLLKYSEQPLEQVTLAVLRGKPRAQHEQATAPSRCKAGGCSWHQAPQWEEPRWIGGVRSQRHECRIGGLDVLREAGELLGMALQDLGGSMAEELGGEWLGGDGGKDHRSPGAGGRCSERRPSGGHLSAPQVAGWRGQGWM